jgi:hypothetical protein
MPCLDIAREKPTSNHPSQVLCGTLARGCPGAPCRIFSVLCDRSDSGMRHRRSEPTGTTEGRQPTSRALGLVKRKPPAPAAGARPVRGEPKEGRGRRLSCSGPIWPSPSAHERVPGLYCYSQPTPCQIWEPFPLRYRATMPEDPPWARHRCEPLKHLERMSL